MNTSHNSTECLNKSEAGFWKCDKCYFDIDSSVEHQRGSVISPLKCPYWNCGKMFSTHSELMSYKINDHASDTRNCYYRPTVEVLILVVYKSKMLQIGLSSRHPEVHQKRIS